jgi:hypothetical protein
VAFTDSFLPLIGALGLPGRVDRGRRGIVPGTSPESAGVEMQTKYGMV